VAWYKIRIEGSVFGLKVRKHRFSLFGFGSHATYSGFYATRYIEADSLDLAFVALKDRLHDELNNGLVGSKIINVSKWVLDSAEEVADPGERKSIGGFTFY